MTEFSYIEEKKRKRIAELETKLERAEKRLAFRGKVTIGVFCDACSSWEQMAWEAGIENDELQGRVEKVREWAESCEKLYPYEIPYLMLESLKAIIGEGKK